MRLSVVLIKIDRNSFRYPKFAHLSQLMKILVDQYTYQKQFCLQCIICFKNTHCILIFSVLNYSGKNEYSLAFLLRKMTGYF